MIERGNRYKRNTDGATRSQLIRKGNEFFNAKKYTSAEKIFVTVDYKDGIIRLADYYFDKGDTYNAFRLYFLSDNQKKIETVCEQAANALTRWIHEDDNSGEEAEKILKIN